MSGIDRWLWVGFAAAAAFLLVFVANVVVTAVATAVNFDGYAANGALQIYNPLRRIAQGELPGRDFPFFHGVGVPLLHYPLFAIFGGNVFASELSRYLLSPLLFLGTAAVFFGAYFKHARKAVIATGIYVAVSLAFNDIVAPGNSIIGVRSTLPILVAAILLWKPRHSWHFGLVRLDLRLGFAMLGLGVAVAFGTEQAIAAIIAYFVVRVLVLWRHATWPQRIAQLLLEGLLIMAVGFGTLSLATGGHAWSAIKYALIEIPQDQGWYFGVPPNQFLTISKAIESLGAEQVPFILMTCLASIAVLIVARPLGRVDAHRARTFLYLAVYGIFACVSFLGYFWPPTQMAPLGRAAGLVLVAVTFDLITSEETWRIARERAGRIAGVTRNLLALTLVVAVLGFGLATATQVLSIRAQPLGDVFSKAVQAPREDDYFASGANWRERLDVFDEEIPASATVWSTYASLYESERGSIHPSAAGEDYIIHALGSERRAAYVAQFIEDRPEYAITLKPSYFVYEQWLWQGDPEFYAELVTHYEVVSENSAHYLWKLDADAEPEARPWTTVADAGNSFTFERDEAASTAVYEMRITYDASAHLPLVGNIPRYLVIPNGSGLVYPVSLPPGDRSYTILVPMMEGQSTSTFVVSAEGIIPTASIDVSKVEVRELDMPARNRIVFLDNFCAYGPANQVTACRSMTIAEEEVHQTP
jgi:hypothetical protein